MCGRYTVTVTIEELIAYYDLDDTTHVPYHVPKYNIAPTQSVLAVIHDGEKLRIGELRWGLIPSWAKEEKIAAQMINARAETLAEKPAFKLAFARKRCLIPADSFYEWKATPNGKQPYRIIVKERNLFSFAGLYETWTSPAGDKISTCTIVTTTANGFMANLHHRMPVILPRQQEQTWLDRSITDASGLAQLLQPYADHLMMAYPVSTAVGNVRYQDKTCIQEVSINEK
jgi:putative SOS response-associated peptidase YedK